MIDRKPLPGKFVWFEHASDDAKKAQAFYREVLGWKVMPMPMGTGTYEMIATGETPDTMVGGYSQAKNGRNGSHWISYVSVDDVDATVKAATANGGTVISPPSDIPGVGRVATIADPQGAEISLLKNVSGDPPDATAPAGRFFWDELHTRDAETVLPFYEKVLGFSHRATEEANGGPYYILSKGGVDRGGVTDHLAAAEQPHWLPYVAVDDPDATVAVAKKLGAAVPLGPADIRGVGRFGVVKDPTGALLAIMKPMPRG